MPGGLPGREITPGVEPTRDESRFLYGLLYDKRSSNDPIDLIAAVPSAPWSGNIKFGAPGHLGFMLAASEDNDVSMAAIIFTIHIIKREGLLFLGRDLTHTC